RAQSYELLVRTVIEPMESSCDAGLRIADLGAGCGWLSYRLAERGHQCLAIDIHDDPLDGLGANANFSHDFECIQSEFNIFDLTDRSVDIAIFNGSLHYAEDIAAALSEAMRVVLDRGMVVVTDTPVYRSKEAGEMMLAERRTRFMQRYGF